VNIIAKWTTTDSIYAHHVSAMISQLILLHQARTFRFKFLIIKENYHPQHLLSYNHFKVNQKHKSLIKKLLNGNGCNVGLLKRLTSCLVKLFSLLAFIMGTSSSLTSSKQSFVGVATFMTCDRYLQRKPRLVKMLGG
jgi:hypothetical protein